MLLFLTQYFTEIHISPPTLKIKSCFSALENYFWPNQRNCAADFFQYFWKLFAKVKQKAVRVNIHQSTKLLHGPSMRSGTLAGVSKQKPALRFCVLLGFLLM